MSEQQHGKIIGELGAQKYPLIIKLDEFKGNRVLDIRRYFKDERSDALQPTKKGLTITAGIFNSLEEIAYKYGQEIRSWLTEPTNNTGQEMVARSKAADNCGYDYQDYHIKFDDWKGDRFFNVESEGAVNVITFNKKHPYIESILERKNPEEALKNIAAIIASFKRASYRFDNLDFNYSALIDSLEYEWGKLLKSYDQGRWNG